MNPYASRQSNIFAIDVALSSRISALEKRVAELEQVAELEHPGWENLKDELASLARKRIAAALVVCDGNKTKAAKFLGLASYQTVNNWIKRYDVADSEND